jgi:hypothetical protein
MKDKLYLILYLNNIKFNVYFQKNIIIIYMINKNKNQTGGDGYSFNLSQPIGGNPAFIRYSNNIKPVFDGSLLDDSTGDYINVDERMWGGSGNKKKNTENNDCSCVKNKNRSIYDLIKLNGGNNPDSKKITQFDAIREVSYSLSPLKLNDLTQLNVKLFNHILKRKNEKKSIQFGGYISSLEEILAPLGRNNLLVLASLLLLHHFAVERYFVENKKLKFVKSKDISGGSSFLGTINDILAPIGVDPLGTSLILVGIQQAFSIKNQNKSEKNSNNKNIELIKSKKIIKQKGGLNPLRQLIEPLGTNAFLAAGLLIVIERFFSSKVSDIKNNTKSDNTNTKIKSSKKEPKKMLKGGRLNIYYEKLFNLLAPITFNAFATEDFLHKMSISKK